jgi:hypothetical protein
MIYNKKICLLSHEKRPDFNLEMISWMNYFKTIYDFPILVYPTIEYSNAFFSEYFSRLQLSFALLSLLFFLYMSHSRLSSCPYKKHEQMCTFISQNKLIHVV